MEIITALNETLPVKNTLSGEASQQIEAPTTDETRSSELLPLSELEIEAIRDATQDWLGPQYVFGPIDSGFEAFDQASQIVEDITGIQRLEASGATYRKYCQAFSYLIEEVLDDIEFRLDNDDPEERKIALRYLYGLCSGLFAVTSTLESVGRGPRLLELTAKTLEIQDPNHALYQEFLGALNYQFSFGESTEDIAKVFEGKTAAEKINLIRILEHVGFTSVGSGYGNADTKIAKTLRQLMADPTPLVSIIASGAYKTLHANITIDRANMVYEEDNREWQSVKQYVLNLRQKAFDTEINYPDFPLDKDQHLLPISSDAFAVTDAYLDIMRIGFYPIRKRESKDRAGNSKSARIEDAITDLRVAPFGQVKLDNPALLIRIMHNPKVKMHLENELGIQLDQLSLQSQMYLLNYLANAKQQDYEVLKECAQKQGDYKKTFLESFLALQLDENFGEVLIEITKHVSPEKTAEILTDIQVIRLHAETLRSAINVNKENEVYGQGLHFGLVKRMTEILSLVVPLEQNEQIVVRHPYSKTVELSEVTSRDVMNALKLMCASLILLNHDLKAKPVASGPVPNNPHTTSIVLQHGSVLVRDQQTNQGEARIAFRVNLPNDFLKEMGLVSQGEKVSSTDRAVSIRLDLEDTTNMIALDIGGLLLNPKSGEVQKLNHLLARTTAAGAQRMANKLNQQGEAGSHHIHEGFAPRASNPQQFTSFSQKLLEKLRSPLLPE